MKSTIFRMLARYGAICGLTLLIACFAMSIIRAESRVLAVTGRNQDPAMLWSKTEFHSDVIKESKFKEKRDDWCVRPAWPVTIGGQSNNLKSCDEEKWKDLGEKVVVNNIARLTGNKTNRPNRYNLLFENRKPILSPQRFSVTVAFGGSNAAVVESVVVLEAGGGECNITLHDGTATPCLTTRPVQTIKILDGMNVQNRKTVANISINGDGIVKFLPVQRNWSYGIDKKLAFNKSTELNCLSRREVLNNSRVERVVSIKSSENSISIWCSNDAELPSTELGRLAALIREPERNKASPSEIISTFTPKVDMELAQIVNSIGCGTKCDVQVTMMDAMTGDVRALVSNRNHSSNEMAVDNFELQKPGSVIKVIYSQAILSTVPELKSLKMNGFNGDKCRLLDIKASQSCEAASARKGVRGYYVDSHSTPGSIDFTSFIAESENVYATSLLYLGSTVPASDGGCREDQKDNAARGLSMVSGGSEYRPESTLVPSGGNQAVPYSAWLSNRVGLFSEQSAKGDVARCAPNRMPPWYVYMAKNMNIFNRTNGNDRYRSYIWGDVLKGSLENHQGLSPAREFSGFDANEFNSDFTNRAYKWVYGGGDYTWSNVSVAEQVSAIVAKRHVLANVVSSMPRKFVVFDDNEKSAADAILTGMKHVLVDGTAKELCKASGLPIDCAGGAATLLHPTFGKLTVLGKTGTPRKIVTVSTGGERGLWDIFAVVLREDFRKGYEKDWCNGKKEVKIGSSASMESICTIDGGSDATRLMEVIQNKIESSSQSRKSRWNEKYVREEFRRWLTAQLDRSTSIRESRLDSRPIGYIEGAEDEFEDSEKRLVLVIAQAAPGGESNTFAKACTFMMSVNKEGEEKHILFAKKLITSIVADKNHTLLGACGFMPKGLNAT